MDFQQIVGERRRQSVMALQEILGFRGEITTTIEFAAECRSPHAR
jgi:hypothetical protein